MASVRELEREAGPERATGKGRGGGAGHTPTERGAETEGWKQQRDAKTRE